MGRMKLDGFDTLCRMILVRHGESGYTGQGIDLTPKGVLDMNSTAQRIKRELEGIRRVQVWTSSAPRALSSAAIVCNLVGKGSRPIIHGALDPVGVRDLSRTAAGKKYLASRGIFMEPETAAAKIAKVGLAQFDRDYFEDETFDDGRYFEPRSSCRCRIKGVVREVMTHAHVAPTPKAIVLMSHVECLAYPVHELFRVNVSLHDPMRRAEYAVIDLGRCDIGDDYLEVRGRFRDKTLSGVRVDFRDEIEFGSLVTDPVTA